MTLAQAAGAVVPKPPSASASEPRKEQLRKEWQNYNQMVSDMKNDLFATLDKTELQTVNKIEIRVEGGLDGTKGDDVQNCYALMDNGHPAVLLGQGFLRSLWYFIESLIYAEKYRAYDKHEKYIGFVLTSWQSNLTAASENRPPRFIPSPSEYFHWNKATIDTVDEAASPVWAEAVACVLAHEVGHHVLKHTSRNYLAEPLPAKRRAEEDADAWATSTLCRAGHPPLFGGAAIAYLQALYDDLGSNTTHPADACRSRALFVASIEQADKFKDGLAAKGHTPADLRRVLKARLAQFDATGACKH
jgi:hypothetical protein